MKDFCDCMVPRGFLRFHILRILNEGDMHGYGLMKRIEKETGFWKPTPGAIYPTLKSLLNSRDIEKTEKEGKIIYKLTPDGRRSIKDIGKTFEEGKKRFIVMLSEMFDINQKDMEGIVSEFREFHLREENKRFFPILSDTRRIIMSIKSEQGWKDAENIIKRTNSELKKLR